MQQQDVILFGASKLGEIAYIMLKDMYNIIYYCDNDSSKIGSFINGIEVISTEDLLKIDKSLKIIITSSYYSTIVKQLIDMNKENFEVFSISINPHSETTKLNKFNLREINLGKFLKSIENKIQLNNLTFITGGSGILDYAFLKALAIKFNIESFLEIGSFIGESINNISKVVKKCYSLSLPNEFSAHIFERRNMNNFSSYFMNGQDNIIQYKCDSKNFDFNLIDEKVGLVFIDGDHSYSGVFSDTRNIFNIIDTSKAIVVWHDFKQGHEYRLPVINAVFDATPKELHKNIFLVDIYYCGL